MSRGRHHPRAVFAAVGDGRSSRRVDHDDHDFYDDDHYCGIVHDHHDCTLFYHDNHGAFHDDND